jgi:lycopene cyclase domain-containing protein
MKFTYILVLFFSAVIPFIYSFHNKLNFHRYFKPFLAANLITAVVFLVWDIIFTKSGVWGFSNEYTIGLRISGLPIEEILFFILIPFACVFTYHSISKFIRIEWKPASENIFLIILAGILLIAGLFNIDKKYTSVTFISATLIILLLKFAFRVKWLPQFFTIYPVLLIPFLVVNGILTGSFLENPVVWYNDSENLSLRIFTIPVEDLIYGMELLMLNIFFYEFFKGKFISDNLT